MTAAAQIEATFRAERAFLQRRLDELLTAV
jgi:hypothetical protein